MAWRKFAYKAKDDNKDSLFTAMTARDPLLEADNVIQHCVDNNILKDFILQEETNILTFLRQELQNYSISLQLEVGSEESGNKKLYSGQDKFKDMAERNPHLKTMQQRFKLDIEF